MGKVECLYNGCKVHPRNGKYCSKHSKKSKVVVKKSKAGTSGNKSEIRAMNANWNWEGNGNFQEMMSKLQIGSPKSGSNNNRIKTYQRCRHNRVMKNGCKDCYANDRLQIIRMGKERDAIARVKRVRASVRADMNRKVIREMKAASQRGVKKKSPKGASQGRPRFRPKTGQPNVKSIAVRVGSRAGGMNSVVGSVGGVRRKSPNRGMVSRAGTSHTHALQDMMKNMKITKSKRRSPTSIYPKNFPKLQGHYKRKGERNCKKPGCCGRIGFNNMGYANKTSSRIGSCRTCGQVASQYGVMEGGNQGTLSRYGVIHRNKSGNSVGFDNSNKENYFSNNHP